MLITDSVLYQKIGIVHVNFIESWIAMKNSNPGYSHSWPHFTVIDLSYFLVFFLKLAVAGLLPVKSPCKKHVRQVLWVFLPQWWILPFFPSDGPMFVLSQWSNRYWINTAELISSDFPEDVIICGMNGYGYGLFHTKVDEMWKFLSLVHTFEMIFSCSHGCHKVYSVSLLPITSIVSLYCEHPRKWYGRCPAFPYSS